LVTEHNLEALFLANDDFQNIERELNVFCPFEAIGMVDQEIRHGRFMRYLFDPLRPHGFGSDCLRALMSAAAGAMSDVGTGPISPLDVHLMDLDSAIVPQAEYKAIDILVEIPAEKVVVAIELKIDASEHSGQLSRYRKIVEADWPILDGWRHILLFLTKRGENPSETHGTSWSPLPLNDLVSEFESVYARGGGATGARPLLAAYIAMLRRRHLTDERMEELARRLWAQHREALEYLADRRPDAASELFEMLLSDQSGLAKRLSELTGHSLLCEKSTKTYVRFAVESWDKIPGFLTGTGWPPSPRLMLYEIYRDTKGGVRCHFQLGPGDQQTRNFVFNALKSGGCAVGGNWELYPKWRTLASQVLVKNVEDSAQGSSKYELLETLIGGFLGKHLPCYCSSLEALIKGRVEN
jgi:hypothetical protein